MSGGIPSWLHEATPGVVALRGRDSQGVTFGDLAASVARFEQVIREAGATGIICNSGLGLAETITWAVAAMDLGLPCVLGGGVLSNESLFGMTPRDPFSHCCNGFNLEAIPSTDDSRVSHRPLDRDTVVLLTSGTTGQPKLAIQTWRGLQASVRRGNSLKQRKWLLTYGATRFAGIQVWLHSLANEGTLLFSEQPGVNTLIELFLTHRPEMISATPTFWRQVLRSVSPEQLAQGPPRVITLGGEAADKTLLATLKTLFPDTRIVQIYASTEAGVGITVNDGQEGLPASVLEQGFEGNEFKMLDGELFIRSKSAMHGYVSQPASVLTENGFVATGDLFQRVGDRIVFQGRKDGRLNVGGHKVDPSEIERHALSVAGVALVQTYARKSPVLGEVPALRFVPMPGHSGQKVCRALQQAFKDFPPYKIPRLIEAVPDLETTDTGKIRRGI